MISNFISDSILFILFATLLILSVRLNFLIILSHRRLKLSPGEDGECTYLCTNSTNTVLKCKNPFGPDNITLLNECLTCKHRYLREKNISNQDNIIMSWGIWGILYSTLSSGLSILATVTYLIKIMEYFGRI